MKLKTKDLDIKGYIGAHVDSGAKHFVTKYDVADIDDIYKIAQIIRYDESFSPTGLNVNFYKVNHKNEIQVITYEKELEAIKLQNEQERLRAEQEFAQMMEMNRLQSDRDKKMMMYVGLGLAGVVVISLITRK